MSDIDRSKLPSRALLDTGVLIRALGERRSDPVAASCRALFDEILAVGRVVLVAAPSIAEILRGRESAPVPRTRGLVVVPFDLEAAVALSQKLPFAVLKRSRDEAGEVMSYMKYDALIIACAIRHRAEVIVSCDEPMARLAERAGLECRAPRDYEHAQQQLFDAAEDADDDPSVPF